MNYLHNVSHKPILDREMRNISRLEQSIRPQWRLADTKGNQKHKWLGNRDEQWMEGSPRKLKRTRIMRNPVDEVSLDTTTQSLKKLRSRDLKRKRSDQSKILKFPPHYDHEPWSWQVVGLLKLCNIVRICFRRNWWPSIWP